jgi:hypothetical protein
MAQAVDADDRPPAELVQNDLRPLDIEDMLDETPTIKELLSYANVSPDWRAMGVLLNIHASKLDEIEYENHPRLWQKLDRVYQFWLKTHKKPTRRQIINALRNEIIGNFALAKEYLKSLEDNKLRRQSTVLRERHDMNPRKQTSEISLTQIAVTPLSSLLPPSPASHTPPEAPLPSSSNPEAPMQEPSEIQHMIEMSTHHPIQQTTSISNMRQSSEISLQTPGLSPSSRAPSETPLQLSPNHDPDELEIQEQSKKPQSPPTQSSNKPLGGITRRRYHKLKKRCQKCTVGEGINYLIAIGFMGIFACCMIINITIGSLQSDVTRNFFNNTPVLDCYLFAECRGQHCNFKLNSYACGMSWGIYSLIGLMSLGFIISSIAKGLLASTAKLVNIMSVLIVEVITLLVFLVIAVAMSLTVSVGHITTCRSIENYYGRPGQGCEDRQFPLSDFNYTNRANLIESTSWIMSILIFAALIVIIIRLILSIKKKVKNRNSNTENN